MNDFIKHQFDRLRRRLMPFFDLTAWVLLAASLVPLVLIDPAMVWTLVQWTLYALAIAANTVVVARLFLPQVDLSEWVALARAGEVSAALVILAVALVLSSIFLGVVLWARA